MSLRRAVFLDRDGVLNRVFIRGGVPCPPATLDELELVPDAPELLQRLHRAGFLLLLVTNQPDVGRGLQSCELVEEIHARLRAELPLDDLFVCYHGGHEQPPCACRKPLPGLLLEAAGRHGVDLASSFVIGDRWRDIDAGAAAGCRTLWIDHGYAERRPAHPAGARVATLAEAVDCILRYTDSS